MALLRRYTLKNFKLILFVTIFIILLVSVLVFVGNTNTSRQINENSVENQITQNDQKNSVETKEVTNPAMYFTIKSCIDSYMKYISEENKEAIYCLLSKNYIQENNIDTNNVLEYVEKLSSKDLDFSIKEMKAENEGKDLQTYYINGTIRDNNNNKKEAKITVNIDITNKVFNIIPTVEEGVFDE